MRKNVFKSCGLFACAVVLLITMSSATPQCPKDTNYTVIYYPNPDNCNSYYLCENGVSYPMHCPLGLFFNANSNMCDWPSNYEAEYNCQGGIVSGDGDAYYGGELPEVVISCPSLSQKYGKCREMKVEEGMYGYCRFDCIKTGDINSSCSAFMVHLINFCIALEYSMDGPY